MSDGTRTNPPTVNLNDRRELKKFCRFLRAMKEPGAQDWEVYARFYGQVVYEAKEERT